jgi:hypothetical protein
MKDFTMGRTGPQEKTASTATKDIDEMIQKGAGSDTASPDA